MKKIFKTLLIGGVALNMMTSCSDFLDQRSPSELTEETVFNSIYYANNVLNKVYGSLTNDQTYSQYFAFVWCLNSDYELVDGFGADASNTSSERGNMNYNQNPGWANLSKAWDAMFSAIEYANIVVDGINNSELITAGGSTQTEAERIKAEAQVLRAMLYLDLIRNFGDLPMKMESSKPDLSNAYLAKTDRDVILDYLINDLEDAAEHLSWAGSVSTEHVTKGYAHSLLANIALTRAGWAIRESAKAGYETAPNSDAAYPTQRPGTEERQKLYELALKHLNIVIGSGKHQLNPSIENHWDMVNKLKLDETYRENIFEIPMGLGRSGELGYTVGVRINGASSKYGEKGNSSGKMKVCAPYFWSFDHDDLRRDLTCAPYTLKETDGKMVESFDGNKPFEIYLAKWDIRKMSEEWRTVAINTGNAKWMSGINVTKMRYPYVLLMYAEAENEVNQGPTSEAYAAVNQVVRRGYGKPVNTPDGSVDWSGMDYTEFREEIQRERARELAYESLRKGDLIRWGIFLTQMKDCLADANNAKATFGNVTARDVLWPIPSYEMALNTNLKQNPGW